MDLELTMKQTQKLALTPQMEQSLSILQMGGPELEQYMEDTVLSNPMLTCQEPEDGEREEPEAEPSEWLKGISYNYLSRFNIPAELQGKYTLCVGLTDKTKNNEAAIDLAVSGNLKIGKWIFVVELEL